MYAKLRTTLLPALAAALFAVLMASATLTACSPRGRAIAVKDGIGILSKQRAATARAAQHAACAPSAAASDAGAPRSSDAGH